MNTLKQVAPAFVKMAHQIVWCAVATVDAEGHIWSAICEGAKLVRFRPDGSIERIVAFPLKLPGSVMIGGPALDRLFVPTLSPAFMGREADPLDGSTYVIDGLGVTGLAEPRFGG